MYFIFEPYFRRISELIPNTLWNFINQPIPLLSFPKMVSESSDELFILEFLALVISGAGNDHIN